MSNFQSLRMTREGRIPARAWNGLVQAVQRQQINSVVGGEFRNGSTGRTLIIKPGKNGGAAAGHPLQVLPASEGFVSVRPGSIVAAVGGTFIPTIGGDTLLVDPVPELEITANGFVELHLTLTAGAVTAAVIAFVTTLSTSDATNAYHALAAITAWDAGTPITFTITQLVSGSQAYQMCNPADEENPGHLWGLL